MRLTADQNKRVGRLGGDPARPAGQHGYSRFVRVMKILLPSLAAILLALVVVWPKLRFEDPRFHVGFAKLSSKAVQTLAMVNARYFGLDQYNRPFTVTADRAVQENARPDVVDLAEPKADFTTKDGSGVFVQADRGYYHQKSQILDLEGSVSLFHDKGYELHTQKAEVDLAKGTAHGETPVHGQGPQGVIDGQGFQIRNKGADVLVTGRSALTLKAVGRTGREGKSK